MVFGVGRQDGAATSGSNSGPPIWPVDAEGNVDYGPNWPGTGAPPTGFPMSPDVQHNTNDSAVPWTFQRQSSGSADRPRGSMQTDRVSVRPFYQAANYPNYLRALANNPRNPPDVRRRYDIFLDQLRTYTGSELGTTGTVDTAWRTVLVDAQEGRVPALELLQTSGAAAPPGSGRNRFGSSVYTGPRAVVEVQAESDINATANALALEMIGRTLNEKELERVTKRLRKAEQEQPQVTTGGGARTTVQQGLTPTGRQDILREVIAERPEYAQYQIDNTVLDTMLSEFKKREQMVNG